MGALHIETITIVVVITMAKVHEGASVCSQRSPKIVGGIEATNHEIPFMVSLTRRGGHFCGGTIIHELWILTAGHCVCNGLQQIMKPAHIEAVIGVHDITEFAANTYHMDNDGYPKAIGFDSIRPHPDYNCKSSQNDIALLKLTSPLKFSGNVRPSCLSHENHDNEQAIVSGWGWTKESLADGHPSSILKKATVKVWTNEKCEKSYRQNGNPEQIISHSQLCAGYEAGAVDACWADSGGPLISQDHKLVGIVSTGIGCAQPGLPGIYTRVNTYIDWINKVIEEQK